MNEVSNGNAIPATYSICYYQVYRVYAGISVGMGKRWFGKRGNGSITKVPSPGCYGVNSIILRKISKISYSRNTAICINSREIGSGSINADIFRFCDYSITTM